LGQAATVNGEGHHPGLEARVGFPYEGLRDREDAHAKNIRRKLINRGSVGDRFVGMTNKLYISKAEQP
jgi:hypothetical protein